MWSTCSLNFLTGISSYSQVIAISFGLINNITFEANDINTTSSFQGYSPLLKCTARILLARLVIRAYYVSSDMRWSVLC